MKRTSSIPPRRGGGRSRKPRPESAVRPPDDLVEHVEMLADRLEHYPCISGPCSERDPEMACPSCAARFYSRFTLRALKKLQETLPAKKP